MITADMLADIQRLDEALWEGAIVYEADYPALSGDDFMLLLMALLDAPQTLH